MPTVIVIRHVFLNAYKSKDISDSLVRTSHHRVHQQFQYDMPGILSTEKGVDLEEQVFYFDYASWKGNNREMTNEMLYVLVS